MATSLIAERLTEAKQYIVGGDYEQARQVLKPIRKHPTAKRWIEQMDARRPRKVNHLRRTLLIIVIAAVIGLVGLIGYWQVESQIAHAQACAVLAADGHPCE